MADKAPQGKELTLLCKLLKLTTSPNDGEALVAIRKANEQLAKVGGDWERLLFGKVTIIADPFDTIVKPPLHQAPPRGTAPPPPRQPDVDFSDPFGVGGGQHNPQYSPKGPQFTPGPPPGAYQSPPRKPSYYKAQTKPTPKPKAPVTPKKTWEDIKKATINDLD